MKTSIYYTDMADECATDDKARDTVPVMRKKISDNVTRTSMRIKNLEEARTLSLPQGAYITVECNSGEMNKDVRGEIVREVKNVLRTLASSCMREKPRVLVAGLGNRNVTADALGAEVIDRLIVTRKFIEETNSAGRGITNLAGIAPGVFGATGIESFDIIKGVCDRIGATLVIVVDTLATKKAGRLFKSFQITDAGLQPGSAVNGARQKIDSGNLGIPVIAVGVPMTIYARSLVYGGCEETAGADVKAQQKIRAAEKVLGEENISLLLTPKNVDDNVKICADVIADAVNLCFHNSTKKGI